MLLCTRLVEARTLSSPPLYRRHALLGARSPAVLVELRSALDSHDRPRRSSGSTIRVLPQSELTLHLPWQPGKDTQKPPLDYDQRILGVGERLAFYAALVSRSCCQFSCLKRRPSLEMH